MIGSIHHKRVTGKAIFILIFILGFLFALWNTSAEAARSFNMTQITPAAPAEVVMGTTLPFTFRITNTNNGGNTGERIYEMRFRLPGTGTTFSSATAAPAGWTRTAYSTTSVTFRATNWANAITTGNSLDFTPTLVMRRTTADVATERLRDARARYTTTTTGPPFSRTGQTTVNNPGSWMLKSLAASFQITDLSNNPITAVEAGNNFNLVMTVTNRSTANQSTIITSPNPPTPNLIGTVTPNLTSTLYTPNPLTLASGASGTITFTYTTGTTDDGTVSFTAFARNSTGNATSSAITSATLAVSQFTTLLTLNRDCAYGGQTITVTMTLTNKFPYNITNITPTLTPSVGAPVTLQTAPAGGGTVLANGGTLVLTGVYQVNTGLNSPTFPFSFTGSALGTGQTAGNPTRTTPPTTFPNIFRGGYTVTTPPTTNASSTNEELTWTFENNGCTDVDTVLIQIPSGWSWGGEGYSLVDSISGNKVENWIISLPGPNQVRFTAPTTSDRLIKLGTGEFRLLFSATPNTTGISPFTITVTDTAVPTPISDTATQTGVTVNPFNNLSKNGANTKTYREDFQ